MLTNIVENFPRCYMELNETYRADKGVLRAAIMSDIKNILYVPEFLFCDEMFCVELIELVGNFCNRCYLTGEREFFKTKITIYMSKIPENIVKKTKFMLEMYKSTFWLFRKFKTVFKITRDMFSVYVREKHKDFRFSNVVEMLQCFNDILDYASMIKNIKKIAIVEGMLGHTDIDIFDIEKFFVFLDSNPFE
jgi:hypothetical protein